MKCLVVSAHPLTNSLCQQFTHEVSQQLKAMGHEVTVEDLYQHSFDPVLSERERETYYQENYDQSEVSEQVFRLQEAEALILVFPTWWFNFPAILKGWFDRVWVPGVAYDHAPGLASIEPRLNQLKRVMVITTLGSPAWVDWLIMWRPVRRIVKFALIGACARGARVKYHALYGCEKINRGKLDKFRKRVEKSVRQFFG